MMSDEESLLLFISLPDLSCGLRLGNKRGWITCLIFPGSFVHA